MQPTIEAEGACSAEVAFTCAIRSQLTVFPETKRSFPAFSRSMASLVVVAESRDGVKTAHSCDCARAAVAANGVAAKQPQNNLRVNIDDSPGTNYSVERPASR
jgi:hypothetical protein